MQVGDTIHVYSSNADENLMCLAATLGGRVGGNWWVVIYQFTGARIAWLNDERWHPKEGCTTESGKEQTITNHSITSDTTKVFTP